MNVNYQLEKEQKLTQDHVCVLASLFLYVCGLSLFPSPSRWWSCGLAFPCWSLHGQSFISSWCLNTSMCCFVFVAIMVVLSVFPDCCCLEAFHEYFVFLVPWALQLIARQCIHPLTGMQLYLQISCSRYRHVQSQGWLQILQNQTHLGHF